MGTQIHPVNFVIMNEKRHYQAEVGGEGRKGPARHRRNFRQRIPATDEHSDNGRFNWDESVKDHSVKIFIKDYKTAEFMRCDSTWSLDFNEALDFLSVQRAIFWGMKELKTSFEVVKMRTNRLLGSVKIVIPPLLWSTASAQSTQLEGSNRVSSRQRPRRPLDGSMTQTKAPERGAAFDVAGASGSDGKLIFEVSRRIGAVA
jgi:hypothetical protein